MSNKPQDAKSSAKSIFGRAIVDNSETVNNIVNNYGLDAEEVGKIIAIAKEEILKQLAATNADIVSAVNAQGNDIADKLSDIICSKLFGLVSDIDAASKSTEENIKKALQGKLEELNADLSPLVDSVAQDVVSLNNALSDEFKKAQDRYDEVLKRIDSRYFWMQQEAEIRYINLLKHLKTFKADCRVELLQGNECIKDAKFADAEDFFKIALQQDEVKADAYFGLALAQCKVQLVWDYYYDCAQPILYEYRVKGDFFRNNAHYKTALDYATPTQTDKFQTIADKIEFLLNKFWEYTDKEDSANDASFGRDCFVCVKVSDPRDKSKNTPDCDWVFNSDLYNKLKARNLRPFFSEVDVPKSALHDPEYEAKILYALYKAKCLILVCSNEDYLETPYVKNEYNRFLNFARSKGLDDKQLIIVFNGAKISRHALNIFNLYDVEDFDRSRLTVDDLVDWVEARVNKANGCMSAGWLYCPTCGKKYQLGSDKCSVAGHGALVDFETYANMLIVHKNAENEKLNNRLQDLENNASQLEQEKRRLQEEQKKLDAERKKLEEERKKLQRQAKEEVAATLTTKEEPAIITLPENREDIDTAINGEEFTIEDGVLIGKHMTSGNTAISIPDNGITYIAIPDSVTTIGDDAFLCWSSLTSIAIPDSVTTIGSHAFLGCRSLTSIAIPDSVITIGVGVFSNCSSLTMITIPNSVMRICERTFYGCWNLKGVILGSGVSIVGRDAFKGCTALENVSVLSDAQIDEEAFYGCSSLKEISYGGTKWQWQTRAKGCIEPKKRGYIVHCTNGDIIKY